ncbi:MAG: nucleotidyltransferase family protein [Thermodesulfobacteriota bacterium]|nr:nucleotidyltransferase family protein [Thermodesulfobacteriota bacterium]
MTLEQLIKEKSGDIRNIAAHHGARNIRIFGSIVRGDSSAGSDIDFLVDAGPDTSSWFPAGLILDLEEILGCRVEVVTEKGLNPHLREHVLCEAVPL